MWYSGDRAVQRLHEVGDAGHGIHRQTRAAAQVGDVVAWSGLHLVRLRRASDAFSSPTGAGASDLATASASVLRVRRLRSAYGTFHIC
jgi:hypothetical protein